MHQIRQKYKNNRTSSVPLNVNPPKYVWDKLGDLGLSHIVIDGEIIRTPLGGFINHSDEPNCIKVKETVSVDYGDLKSPDISYRYTLFTLRDIKAWEELTIKYTFYEVKK